MDNTDRASRRRIVVILLISVLLGVGAYLSFGRAVYYWKEHFHHYESGVTSGLFALHTMQENYRKDHGTYADSFAQLGVPLGAELAGDSLVWSGPYRFSLIGIVHSQTGSVQDYRIEARPIEYSDRCKRSFLMDSTGYVHFTVENREARLSDPSMPPEN
jgi:hypothetical protein